LASATEQAIGATAGTVVALGPVAQSTFETLRYLKGNHGSREERYFSWTHGQ